VTDRPSQPRAPEKDQLKPFHAKDVTTGQEAADTVAAVLKHAAERDEAAKKKTAPKAQPIWMLPLGLTMAVLATFLLVAPPPWVVVNPIAAQTPEAQLASLERALWIQINAVEAFVLRSGRLPQTLEEAGAGGEGLVYSTTGQTYVLCAEVVGRDPSCFNSAVESPREWGTRMIPDLSGRIGG
jgi:hypothetical protein